NDDDIRRFMEVINRTTQEHPILIDKYLTGREVEVDAVCDGVNILIPGIMEHIERAGIHSGDSISVYPSNTLRPEIQDKIVEYSARLAKALHVIGLINIQFIVYQDEVYVIEVNPRSSRTVPYISKVTGIPIVKLASKVITGAKIRELGYEPGLQPSSPYIAVKMPVFSFEKLRGADIGLGPEMKSTGEVLGIAKNYEEALHKAFLGAGISLPNKKEMLITVRDADKEEIIPLAKRFERLGYKIYSTSGTAKALKAGGVKVETVNRFHGDSPNVADLLYEHRLDMVIDTPTRGSEKNRDGFLIRRIAIETGVHCFTALDTANALATALETADETMTMVNIATI
ncbi:MAG: ATP-grasp domain-containing protein, partial [Clostridiales bacterium]|nr:ATP-grasp domain-containing protein [Clostridiales bacterium]